MAQQAHKVAAAGGEVRVHRENRRDGEGVHAHEPRRAEQHQGRGRLRGRLPDGRPAKDGERDVPHARHPRHRLRHARRVGRVHPAVRMCRAALLHPQAHRGGAPLPPRDTLLPPGEPTGVRTAVPPHSGRTRHGPLRLHHLPAAQALLLAVDGTRRGVRLRVPGRPRPRRGQGALLLHRLAQRGRLARVAPGGGGDKARDAEGGRPDGEERAHRRLLPCAPHRGGHRDLPRRRVRADSHGGPVHLQEGQHRRRPGVLRR